MKKSKLNSKGFSLIELIVVMAIMAILVLLAAPKYLNYVKDAEVIAMEADIRLIEDIVERDQIEDPDKGYPVKDEEADLSDEAKDTIVDDYVDAVGGEDYPKTEDGEPDKDAIIDLSGTKPVDPSKIKDKIKNTKDNPSDYVIITEGPLKGKVYHKDGYKDSDGVYHNGVGGINPTKRRGTPNPLSDFIFEDIDEYTTSIVEYIGSSDTVVLPQKKDDGKRVVSIKAKRYLKEIDELSSQWVSEGVFENKPISSFTANMNEDFTVDETAFYRAFVGQDDIYIDITSDCLTIGERAFSGAIRNNENITLLSDVNITLDSKKDLIIGDEAFRTAFTNSDNDVIIDRNISINLSGDNIDIGYESFAFAFKSYGENVQIIKQNLDLFINSENTLNLGNDSFNELLTGFKNTQSYFDGNVSIKGKDIDVGNSSFSHAFMNQTSRDVDFLIEARGKLNVRNSAFKRMFLLSHEDIQGESSQNINFKIKGEDVEIGATGFGNAFTLYEYDVLSETGSSLKSFIELAIVSENDLKIYDNSFSNAFTNYEGISAELSEQKNIVNISGGNIDLENGAFGHMFSNFRDLPDGKRTAEFMIDASGDINAGEESFQYMFHDYESAMDQDVDITLNGRNISLGNSSFHSAFACYDSGENYTKQDVNFKVRASGDLIINKNAFNSTFRNNLCIAGQYDIDLSGRNTELHEGSFELACQGSSYKEYSNSKDTVRLNIEGRSNLKILDNGSSGAFYQAFANFGQGSQDVKVYLKGPLDISPLGLAGIFAPHPMQETPGDHKQLFKGSSLETDLILWGETN